MKITGERTIQLQDGIVDITIFYDKFTPESAARLRAIKLLVLGVKNGNR